MAVDFNPVLDVTFEAAEDLSSYQYHFVTLDSAGKAQLMNAASDVVIGVLQNAPKSGEEATVRVLGISKVVSATSLAVLLPIKPEYNSITDCGKAIAASTDYTNYAGFVTDLSSAEDDLASILLNIGVCNVIA